MSEKYEVGSIVEGKVVRIKPFGAIVSIGEGAQGLVHISQIANSFVQDINDHLNVGDIVKVKILSIEEETNKISLSIRDALPPAPKPERPERNFKPRDKEQRNENRGQRVNTEYRQPQTAATPTSDFEDKMKEWLKQSNERQAGLNKRANRR